MTHGAGPGFPAGDALDALVAMGLTEDLGSGDVSTRLSVDTGLRCSGELTARSAGVVAGLPLVGMVFAAIDPGVTLEVLHGDGYRADAGQSVARLEGPAGAILTGERLALNFLQHLSGIATLTARYVAAVAGTGCQILDTRKTLPGFRALAKYAVRCGGGRNHRMGLYDRIMLKDNHWSATDQTMDDLMARARREHRGLAVEIEVDSLDQLQRILDLGPEWILLDNFTPEETRRAVSLRDAAGSGALLESSGNVNLETVRSYADAGVDAVSVGRLTHSAPALDIGLDLDPGRRGDRSPVEAAR